MILDGLASRIEAVNCKRQLTNVYVALIEVSEDTIQFEVEHRVKAESLANKISFSFYVHS